MSNFRFHAAKNVLFKEKYFKKMYKSPPPIYMIGHFCNYVVLRVVRLHFLKSTACLLTFIRHVDTKS